MALLQIPITNEDPNYRFQLELEERLYFFEFRYNTRMERWIMDLEDENKITLVAGIPVLINQNLLGQYTDDRLPPGIFIALDESGEDKQPERQSFGNDIKLTYTTSDEVAAIG